MSDEYKAGYYDAYVAEELQDDTRFMVNDGNNDYARGYYDGTDAYIKEVGE